MPSGFGFRRVLHQLCTCREHLNLQPLCACLEYPGGAPWGQVKSAQARAGAWVLNPGPCTCEADVMPVHHLSLIEFANCALVPSWKHCGEWTHWDLNPGPSACEADVIPLHHVPLNSMQTDVLFGYQERRVVWSTPPGI